MKILLTVAILIIGLLADENNRLRGQVNALATDNLATGMMLTRVKIKLDSTSKLVSDLRNGRVD